jgi:hypothetical protein
MKRGNNNNEFLDTSSLTVSESPPLPRYSQKSLPKPARPATGESGRGTSYKLQNNASESNMLEGWTKQGIYEGHNNGHSGDIFELLPVQQAGLPSGYNKSGKIRRSSFDYQLVMKADSKDNDTQGAGDSSSVNGFDKRRRRPSYDRADYSSEKLPTVAQLRNMKSVNGIDSSSPLAPLAKLKSMRSLTEIAGTTGAPPGGLNGGPEDHSDTKDKRSARNSNAGVDSFDRNHVFDRTAQLEAQLVAERKQTIRDRPGPTIKALQPGSAAGNIFRMLVKPSGAVSI